VFHEGFLLSGEKGLRVCDITYARGEWRLQANSRGDA